MTGISPITCATALHAGWEVRCIPVRPDADGDVEPVGAAAVEEEPAGEVVERDRVRVSFAGQQPVTVEL